MRGESAMIFSKESDFEDALVNLLFQKGWCCAAFCELRQDIRHFELKRILTYELLNEFYE